MLRGPAGGDLARWADVRARWVRGVAVWQDRRARDHLREGQGRGGGPVPAGGLPGGVRRGPGPPDGLATDGRQRLLHDPSRRRVRAPPPPRWGLELGSTVVGVDVNNLGP